MHATMKFRVGWLIASTRCIWRCIYTHQSIYTRSHLQWPDYTACYLPPRINAPSIRCTLLCIHPYTHVRLRHARSAPVSLTSTTHRRLINSTIPKTVLRYYHSSSTIIRKPSRILNPSNACSNRNGIFISRIYRFLLICYDPRSFEKSIQIYKIHRSIWYIGGNSLEGIQTKENKLASVQKRISVEAYSLDRLIVV